MKYFLKSGSRFTVTDAEALTFHEELPVGNYMIQQDPQSGTLFLLCVDPFQTVKKVYGGLNQKAKRIYNTFTQRDNSTGVILNGEKGSGKTLLARNLSILAAKDGIPTIIITEPWHDDQFKKLIQDIKQPCIILFDEFEKVYHKRETQTDMLTLLDGVYPTKKMFVLTCNDKYAIDSHMRNRPGRAFYMIDFKELEMGFIKEYCEATLNDKSHIESLCNLSLVFDAFNFDMLKAIVEEMNRYNESPQDSMKMLNVKPEYSNDRTEYTVTAFEGQRKMKPIEYYPLEWRGNPLIGQFEFHVYQKDEAETPAEDSLDALLNTAPKLKRSSRKRLAHEDEEDSDYLFYKQLHPKHITSLDPKEKKFVYRIEGSEYTLHLTQAKEEAYDYMKLI